MTELDDTPLGTEPGPRRPGWRRTIHEIIFEADTPTGKVFDIILLVAIIASVVFVMLESVKSIKAEWGPWLVAAEWTLTALFTLEYVLRLVSVARPWSYATSFFGIVDFIAIAPTYLSLLIPGAHSLVVVRTLRVVRIFRIFKRPTENLF
jgi:voltage-gated potassium channel